MADENYLAALRQQQQAQGNSFGPLTPEQQAQMQRGVTTETHSPWDFAIGAGAGGIAAQLGKYLATRGLTHELPGVLTTIGINGAFGGAMGGLTYMNGPGVRADQNTMRDAEGQPGGFYGNRR